MHYDNLSLVYENIHNPYVIREDAIQHFKYLTQISHRQKELEYFVENVLTQNEIQYLVNEGWGQKLGKAVGKAVGKAGAIAVGAGAMFGGGMRHQQNIDQAARDQFSPNKPVAAQQAQASVQQKSVAAPQQQQQNTQGLQYLQQYTQSSKDNTLKTYVGSVMKQNLDADDLNNVVEMLDGLNKGTVKRDEVIEVLRGYVSMGSLNNSSDAIKSVDSSLGGTVQKARNFNNNQ